MVNPHLQQLAPYPTLEANQAAPQHAKQLLLCVQQFHLQLRLCCMNQDVLQYVGAQVVALLCCMCSPFTQKCFTQCACCVEPCFHIA